MKMKNFVFRFAFHSNSTKFAEKKALDFNAATKPKTADSTNKKITKGDNI